MGLNHKTKRLTVGLVLVCFLMLSGVCLSQGDTSVLPEDWKKSIALLLDGKNNKIGTGFFLILEKGESTFIYLVTCYHVIASHDTISIRLNAKEPKNGTLDFKVSINDTLYTRSHATQDVALIRMRRDHLDPVKVDFRALPKEACAFAEERKKRNISEGDFVFFLGFPLGLSGIKRNLVIARHGMIARMNDEPLPIKGRRHPLDVFIIDGQSFPGNSGSPLILRREIRFPDKVSIPGSIPTVPRKVIGIMCDYLPYQDVAISQRTKRPRVTFEENSGLSLAHPIDIVLEVEQMFFHEQ